MKIFVLISLYMLMALVGLSQITKDLGSGISIEFPNNPTYTLKGKAGVYTAKTDNCMSIAIVQYDAIPNYSEFVKLPQNKQKEFIEIFLDNTVKGILLAAGNKGAEYSRITIGKHRGREASISGINPTNGEQAKKFYKIVYAFDKVYMFQSMYLNDTIEAQQEKEKFLTSIKTK